VAFSPAGSVGGHGPLLANAAYPVVPLTYVADWQQARALRLAPPTPREKDYPKILTAHPVCTISWA